MKEAAHEPDNLPWKSMRVLAERITAHIGAIGTAAPNGRWITVVYAEETRDNQIHLLTKVQAVKYLRALNSGFLGRHYEAGK